MAKRKKASAPLPKLFGQPPFGLYERTSLYQSEHELEIENYKAILLYEEDRLEVDLGESLLKIYGTDLQVISLEKNRIRLNGILLKLEYSYK